MTTSITQRDTAICNAGSEAPACERQPEPAATQTVTFPVQSAITGRERVQSLIRAVRAEFTPPSVLTEPAASLPVLSGYAHRGAWTASPAAFTDEAGRYHPPGRIRALGIWWWRLVGCPVTVVCRYLEWIAQRPGRFLTVVGLIIALIV